MTIADYVIARLSKICPHAFTVAGGGVMYIIDSLGRNKEIATTHMVHEQGTALAAESYARLSNSVGLAVVTSGPGGINALNGVANAWYDSIPLIMVSGQVKRADLLTGTGCRQVGLQETDIISMVKSITKYAKTLIDPNNISAEITQAIHLATDGRPGPVWIDIPVDIQGMEYKPDTQLLSPPISNQTYDTHRISEVSKIITNDLLPNSKYPLILVGNGGRSAKSKILELSTSSLIPIVTTRQAADMFCNKDATYLGNVRDFAHQHIHDAIDRCDLLLILGARLTPRLTAYNLEGFAPNAKKVLVDIDNNEISRVSKLLTIGVCSDVSKFIDSLFADMSSNKPYNYANWLTTCHESKTQNIEYPKPENNKISMYDFSIQLSNMLPEDAVILSGSSGLAVDIFSLMLDIKREQRVFYDKGTLAMGLEIPQAIGASLAAPNRKVISMSGDSGFQLNIHDLEIVKRLSLPITFFVINNNGYDMIRQSQMTHFNRTTGADSDSGFTVPDTNKIATAYGIENYNIATTDDIQEILNIAINNTLPTIVTVNVIPNEIRTPIKKTPLYKRDTK